MNAHFNTNIRRGWGISELLTEKLADKTTDLLNTAPNSSALDIQYSPQEEKLSTACLFASRPTVNEFRLKPECPMSVLFLIYREMTCHLFVS